LIRHGWGKDNPAFRQVFSTLFLPEGTIEQTHWLSDLARITASRENAAEMREAFYQINVTHLAPQITAPTLVLHAQEDAMCPFEEGRLMAALIPNAKFVPLKSKNHILLEQEPAWEQFLLEVHQFLNLESQPVLQNVVPATQPEALPSSTQVKRLQLTEKLTEREQEILELIAQGLSNTQIGEQLVLSPKTVKNHITHIFSKMQVNTRAEAIVQARIVGFGT
jgi:ATP/maltotriose-dependent transcriptional regulator MalT